MIERRVDEDTAVVPCSRLDANRLVNEAALAERLVGEHDGCASTSSARLGVKQ